MEWRSPKGLRRTGSSRGLVYNGSATGGRRGGVLAPREFLGQLTRYRVN